MSLQSTPNAQRLHIAIYGRRNAGKSTLINMLCGQEVSLVSSVAGTTCDPVYKAMELPGLGPVLFCDTAGFDDEGVLGKQRVEKTKTMLNKTDVAIVLFHEENIVDELAWLQKLNEKKIPVLCIFNQYTKEDASTYQAWEDQVKKTIHCMDVADIKCRSTILQELTRLLPSDLQAPSIVGHLVHAFDCVLLVMPQDAQAPKGRLILPQVQTIRELLDLHCVVQCCTPDTYEQALAFLQNPPHLIICDSQVFKEVLKKKPKGSLLTSFSVLFARYKGDSEYFVEGAKAIAMLHSHARILIAEACTHAPMNEDIGRVKLPRLLRKHIGETIHIDMVNGMDFPSDVSAYDLIIHCGACMFHRTYVLSRVEQVKKQGVSMTNYGMVLAYLQGILDRIEF